MTPTIPQVSDAGRYNVTQTCSLLMIHRNTLERYRQTGRIRCGWRSDKKTKYYLGKEIKRLWLTL